MTQFRQVMIKLSFMTYITLFEREDAMHFWRLNQRNMLKAVAGSNVIRCMRDKIGRASCRERVLELV